MKVIGLSGFNFPHKTNPLIVPFLKSNPKHIHDIRRFSGWFGTFGLFFQILGMS
jgi:hypothetical protein